jgi:pimeloyl-ACP methyl ester carboxylesterase
MDATSAIAAADDAKLRFEVAGEGPPVVLLHGFSLDMRSWDDQFAALAPTHRVVRYDLRGFGRSDLPTAAPYDHVEDLGAVLDAAAMPRADLVGLSLGANVVLGFALRHPERTRRLVLVSPGLPGYRWKGARPPEAAAAHAKVHGIESTKAFWLGNELFAAARRRPAVGARLAAIMADYSGWHWANSNPALPLPTTLEKLAQCRIPTLVVSGSEDLEDYRAIAALIAGTMPDARLEVMDGAGHMAPMEEPAHFNRLLGSFLAG